MQESVGRFRRVSEMLVILNQRYGLGLSYKSFWSAAVAGQIPSYREGREYRFAESDEQVIADHFKPRPHDLRAA